MSEQIEKIISDEETGKRLDVVCAQIYPDFTRSYFRKLIDEEKVLVDGQKTKASKKLKKGERLTITLEEPKAIEAVPQPIDLDILYEDGDLIVVNKAQGMVVHPAPGAPDNTLVNALLYHTKDLSGINGKLRPGIVHRIDKDTAGILVVAKNNKAHQGLSEQLKDHSMTREYVALVKGNVPQEKGIIDMPIGRDPGNRLKYKVTDKNSKEAVTHFKVLKRFNNYTLCSFRLETGRTHQIRVHMSHIGHPIAGDPLYGGEKNKFKTEGQLLVAKKLGFVHPSSGDYMEFEIDLPDYFKKILENL